MPSSTKELFIFKRPNDNEIGDDRLILVQSKSSITMNAIVYWLKQVTIETTNIQPSVRNNISIDCQELYDTIVSKKFIEHISPLSCHKNENIEIISIPRVF